MCVCVAVYTFSCPQVHERQGAFSKHSRLKTKDRHYILPNIKFSNVFLINNSTLLFVFLNALFTNINEGRKIEENILNPLQYITTPNYDLSDKHKVKSQLLDNEN